MLPPKPWTRPASALALVLALACSHTSNPTAPDTSRDFAQGTYSTAAVRIADGPGGNPVLSQTEDSMTFQGLRSDLAPGKVIVSTVGQGALRKVLSVSTVGGNTVVQTTQAALTDAFDKLKLDASLPFDPKSLGDLVVNEPGLEIKWTTLPAPLATAGAAVPGGGPALSITFNNGAFGASRDFELNGSYTLAADPTCTVEIDRASGALLPSVKTFATTIRTTFTGTISLKSAYGGSLSGTKKWCDKDFGTPTVVGPLLFVPHLKIESSISGTAAGSTTYTLNAGLDASGQVAYHRGQGWTTAKSASPSLSLSADAETELGVHLVPLSVELSYNLYGIVGPNLAAKLEASGSATHTTQNGQEGVELKAEAALKGEVGVVARVPDYLEKVLPDIGASISVPFDILEKSFTKFIPFTGTSSIVVADNGSAPDDIFSVTLDGTYLGRTDKGGTGSFRVTHLKPGQHTLTITCLDDGDNGNNIGTLGISLSNGFTFEGGATTLSDLLELNETKSYVVNVPAAPRIVPALPMQVNRARE